MRARRMRARAAPTSLRRASRDRRRAVRDSALRQLLRHVRARFRDAEVGGARAARPASRARWTAACLAARSARCCYSRGGGGSRTRRRRRTAARRAAAPVRRMRRTASRRRPGGADESARTVGRGRPRLPRRPPRAALRKEGWAVGSDGLCEQCSDEVRSAARLRGVGGGVLVIIAAVTLAAMLPRTPKAAEGEEEARRAKTRLRRSRGSGAASALPVTASGRLRRASMRARSADEIRGASVQEQTSGD